MTLTLESIVLLILVAIFWGATNPFMKKGAVGIEQVKATSGFMQLISEIKFLFTNYNYMGPFLINQCGSILYYFTLQTTDLSLAVPVANSLTFLCTALTGRILGESKTHISTYIGMFLILCGTTLCCFDKINAIQAKSEL